MQSFLKTVPSKRYAHRVFFGIGLILSALLAGEITFQNGIRAAELPPNPAGFEIIAGFRTPYHPCNSVIANFLFSTRSARTLAIAAYAAGGKVELISERDRTAIRVTGPQWARAGIDSSVVQFLNETPLTDPVALSHAIAETARIPQPGFRDSVEQDIERRLLGLQDAPNMSESSLDRRSTRLNSSHRT